MLTKRVSAGNAPERVTVNVTDPPFSLTGFGLADTE